MNSKNYSYKNMKIPLINKYPTRVDISYLYDISDYNPNENSATFLVRQNEDVLGIQKKQSLMDRFNIAGLNEIHRGVLWNIKVKSGNFDRVVKKVLDSQILFNPFSQRCYKYE